MKRCPTCRATGTLEEADVLESIKLRNHTFKTKVPALRCRECNESSFLLHDLIRFNLRVAVELAKAGKISSETMRFLRKAINLRGVDLAELLDVAPETLSRWETGKQPIELRAMALLGLLVRDAYEGRTTAMDNLKALKKQKPLGKRINLTGEVGFAARLKGAKSF